MAYCHVSASILRCILIMKVLKLAAYLPGEIIQAAISRIVSNIAVGANRTDRDNGNSTCLRRM